MSDIKWIKIATDIFDDEKILLIESLPSSDSILVIWLKLLTFAGKQNNSGVLMLNDRIAYTEEMLATVFRRDINTVRMALRAFEEYGMIEVIEGVITIPNWSKHQNLDAIERKREYQKHYMQERREKQKMIACKTNSKSNSKSNSKTNSKTNVSCIEEEGYKEEGYKEEGYKEEINNSQHNSVDCGNKLPLKTIIAAWNQNNNLSKVTKLETSTSRYKMLQARFKQYGEEGILKAIENIVKSDFLQGFTSDFRITFDWFVKPNNFVKVLEGNYTNKGAKGTNGEHNGNSREIQYSEAELIQRNFKAPPGFDEVTDF